ncbi:periplasmic chaperone for outer membrane proteins Skp [Marinobacter daqiaonensis]|uniref:Periplasmic chaperone for outer membrane proteins Skp n=1 Tax=Marinobacter daqiaonensis TaxID=650891 RepID=A0A1I6H8C9_9GAMM|nr:OmpH family outer membrane protein [Marinobacter daqiaonensis]SFR50628.1 periplasmic chaperone for outer membrane proteins Skp [Marinobacter daqiaonensis]
MVDVKDWLLNTQGVRLVTLVLALLLAGQVSAQTRVGVVDLRQALFASDEAQAFSEQLKREFTEPEQQVREAQQEARALQERLQKDGAMMNEQERERLASEFQQKAQAFSAMKQQLDQTLSSRKQAFIDEARPEVDAAVKELMEEHDLDMILPAEAVVRVKPELNLTQQLLEKLNN